MAGMSNKPISPAVLLMGDSRARLLGFLIAQPGVTMHLREIARRSGVPVGVVQRELSTYESLGLVRRAQAGRLVQFTVTGQSPLLAPLSEIIVQSGGIPAAIRSALSGLAGDIAFAALFGTILSDPDGARRDVDLIVVGTVAYDDVLARVDPLATQWKREFNLRVMSEDGFRRQRRAATRSLAALLAGPRVMLVGDERMIESAS
jgi:IclR helix-turn-helix domain